MGLVVFPSLYLWQPLPSSWGFMESQNFEPEVVSAAMLQLESGQMLIFLPRDWDASKSQMGRLGERVFVQFKGILNHFITLCVCGCVVVDSSQILLVYVFAILACTLQVTLNLYHQKCILQFYLHLGPF